MNATKWTPGPWTVLDYSSGDEHPALVIHSDPDTRVCFMAGPGKLADIARIEANARLIAEAPAMAEALRELLGPDHEPNIGWYGTTASDRKTMFQCEFCRNEHEDAVLLEHDASCPVLLARQLLARLEGRE